MKPHDKVYTRLGKSEHGVGVFAIVDIPKGTDIFEADPNEDIVELSFDYVESLDDENIKKMYHDFCPLEDGIYYCPVSFAVMTPSWYLNSSKENNVDTDEGYNFIANRDIKVGEEIFSNYEDYSEIPPGEIV